VSDADRWASGDAYERYVGRWSRRIAIEFVDWLGLPPGLRWLDVGCGTGALTETLLERAAPAVIVAVDPSAGFLERARARVTDPRVTFALGSAAELGVEDGRADAAIAGLVLNFVPDLATALAEMRRAVRVGGTIAGYVWDYAAGMEFMRHFWDAAVALDPGGAARAEDEGARFPICAPGPLRDAFVGAGMTDVAVRAIDVPTVFTDFADYWDPFLGGTGPGPAYTMSLTEDDRARLRERLRATLPTEPDGSIHLVARAWAARGVTGGPVRPT
jgi:SAM-dependent methyltransferase